MRNVDVVSLTRTKKNKWTRWKMMHSYVALKRTCWLICPCRALRLSLRYGALSVI